MFFLSVGMRAQWEKFGDFSIVEPVLRDNKIYLEKEQSYVALK